jgi:hypothetical protein
MPYADPARRRAYDADRKRRKRAQGWTKKRVDMRLTALEIKNAEDLSGLFNEVVAEVRSADNSALPLEAKLRIKLRAVEIGLRVVEITSLERQIAALQEQPR